MNSHEWRAYGGKLPYKNLNAEVSHPEHPIFCILEIDCSNLSSNKNKPFVINSLSVVWYAHPEHHSQVGQHYGFGSALLPSQCVKPVITSCPCHTLAVLPEGLCWRSLKSLLTSESPPQ